MHLTRNDFERRILAGEHLLVYRGKVLRVSENWLEKHPGGAPALLHFVGRDATDEIEAYHSDEAMVILRRYIIGTVELDKNGLWHPFMPPFMAGWVRKDGKWYNESTQSSPEFDSLPPNVLVVPPSDLSLKEQAQHSEAYHRLHQRVIDAGLYTTRYAAGYGPEALRILCLGSLSAYLYYRNWTTLSAMFLGFMWQQLVFNAHDLGHMGVTHNWAVDRIIATFIADFIGGLSIGWWVEMHNVHHLVTNDPAHDPDIQHLPFFAISPVFFNSIWSTYHKRFMTWDQFASIVVSVQHKLFYIVLIFGRFNLYALSFQHLYNSITTDKRDRNRKWAWPLEIVGLMFFWSWYCAALYGCGSWIRAAAFLLVSHAATSPLHVQLVLSHFSMSTEDLGPIESFPHRQLRTTSDVKCHPSLQFLHGGLHLQVTHHLFPRLPRHNLLEASTLVKAFAAEQGLHYAEFGFVQGNRDVLGVLRGIAEQVKIMGTVAQAETHEAVAHKIAACDSKSKLF